jgi:hypothetical protein
VPALARLDVDLGSFDPYLAAGIYVGTGRIAVGGGAPCVAAGPAAEIGARIAFFRARCFLEAYGGGAAGAHLIGGDWSARAGGYGGLRLGLSL